MVESIVENTRASRHYQEEMLELSKRQSKKYWDRKLAEAKKKEQSKQDSEKCT
jgi:hypothetical protein